MRIFRSSSLKFAAPVLAGCISALVAPVASADQINLTINDPLDTSSFIEGTRWSDLALPSSANDYFTGSLQLRTPTTGDVTFGGKSLSVDFGGSILFKGPGIVTINNLILNGGSLIQGMTGAAPVATLAGNITVNSASTLNTTTEGTRTITINSLISGAGALTIAGGNGTVNLTNTQNTFTGPITFTQTTALNVSSIANGGIASALGASSSDASNLVFNGGVLRISSSTPASTDRLFSMMANGTIQSSGSAAVTFANTGDIVFLETVDRTLTLGGTNTGNNVFAPRITDNPNGGITSLTKADAGAWVLTGTNTYTGTTTVNGGALVFSDLSNLGAGTAINLGGGTLRWATGSTVDVTARTVTLTGGTSGFDTNGQDVTLANPITGSGALRKSGAGILTLSAANTFTGGVTIENNSGGIRITNSGSLGVGVKTIRISGNQGGAQAPTLRLDGSQGSILLPSSMSFVTSNDGLNGAAHPPAIINEAGNNTINGNFTLTSGGGGTKFEIQSGSLTLNGSMTPDTTNRVAHFVGAGSGIVNGAIRNGTNSMAIQKEGTGTWILNGANTFSGTTTVLGGTLITNTASTGNGAVTVSDGATFGVRAAAPSQSFTTSALTLGATGAGLLFNFGAYANPASPLISATNLTVNGAVNVSVGGTNLSVGTYKLLSYTTLLAGSFNNLTLATLPPRTTANLVNNSAGKSLDLNITAFDYPRWTGAQSNIWDLNDGSGNGTQNWSEVNSGNVTRYLQGSAGTDSVLFDDTVAADKTTVNLATTLTPTSVIVNNSTRNYTFQGTGKLSGATSITKQGTGTLVLANTGGNDYTGTTTIDGGTLQVGDGVTAGAGQLGSGAVVNRSTLVFNRPDSVTVNNTIGGAGFVRNIGGATLTLAGNITGLVNIEQASSGILALSGNNSFGGVVTATQGTVRMEHNNALGSTAGGTAIINGATLDLNGFVAPVGEVVTISGSGVGGAGAIVNSVPGGINVGLKNLTLAGDAAIGGTARWDIRDSPNGINGQGFKLTKVGTGDITFREVGETNFGDIQIEQGILRFETTATMGDSTKTVTINSGGTLGFFDSSVVHAKKVVLNGGSINVESGSATLSGVLEGTGGLTKLGNGTLELGGAAANVYTGLSTLSSGTLRLNKAAGTTAIGGELVMNAGTLAFGAANQFGENASVTINGGTWSNGSNFAQTLKNLTVNTSTLQTLNALTITGILSIELGQHDINSAHSITANALSISNFSSLRLGANGSGTTANIGAGGLTLSNGTLQLGQLGGEVSAIVNLGGNLTSSGFSMISNPNTLGPRIIDLQGAMRTFNIIDDSTSISPTIQNGGIIKTGDGRLVLEGASTYQGDTVIQQGTLVVTGSISGSANIDVQADAVLDVSLFPVFGLPDFTLDAAQKLKGRGKVMGPVVINGTLAPGSGIGELTFDSNLTLAGIADFEINKSGLTLDADLATSSTLITFGGTLAVTLTGGSLSFGDTFKLFNAPAFAGSFAAFQLPSLESGLQWDTTKLSLDGTLAVVPEPTSAGLLLAGVATLLGMRRPRRRS